MERLTLEHAIGNKFTAIDCVKYYDSKLTDEKCDFILWELTCYPYDSKMMIDQIHEHFNPPKQ